MTRLTAKSVTISERIHASGTVAITAARTAVPKSTVISSRRFSLTAVHHVCNSDYVPPPGTDICANYYEPCTPPPAHQACELCGGQFHVGQLITYVGEFTFCGDMLGKGAVGVFAGTNMYTRAEPPFLASWDGCTYGDDAPKAGAGQLNLTCGSRDGYDVNSLEWVDCDDIAPYMHESDEVINLSFKKNATVNVTTAFVH